ncbi:MAG TPA: protein translocase subunit SecD [Actinomycetota bacterium]|nr:protein translocase subunit SecD [Actinomycetota bacterium]
MGSRRRTLIVLGLVLVLMAASALVILDKPTQQGLDLQGGTELVYEARGTPAVPEPSGEDVDRAVDIIRDRVDTLGVSEPEISRIGRTQVSVGLPQVQNAQDAIDQVGDTSQLLFYDFEPNVIPLDPDVQGAEERPINRLIDAVEEAQKQKPECFEKDGEPLCTSQTGYYYLFDESSLNPIGTDGQAVTDGSGVGPVKEKQDLFLSFPDNAQPEGTIVEHIPKGYVILREEAPPDDPETEIDESEGAPRGWFLLRDRPELTGDQIRSPEQQTDSTTNEIAVTFDFTGEGQDAFQEVTERIAQRGRDKPEAIGITTPEQAANLSDSFAVVLDGEIVSRPIINFIENPEGIPGNTGAQISGNFSLQEAQDLAEFLRIGALPVDLTLLSQSTVSATLGQEALDGAILAGLAGLALVILFLLAYYRFLGFVAALGLFVYALFFLALIKLIPITLTLPGIAGLILTIGVAADSNIVIFERIKEEIRHGRSMLSAISQGYRKGIATIIDANVITLITAFILFVLASAGVKGFAFTLGIGTIVSLFTAVLFTQAVLAVLGRARFLRSPRFLGAGEREVEWAFDFTGMSKYFFSASGVILAIGAIAFSTQQLNFGIDFESGTRVKAPLAEEASTEDVRAALSDAEIDGVDGAEITAVEEPEFGDNVVQIQGKIPADQAQEVDPALEEAFGLEDDVQTTSVGPTFGEQIARSAVIALIFSMIVISGYVAIRFEAKYAVPILIALIHDILIAGGIYALIGFEVNSATVAAFLTILGYSIYDCVIVFDRIRENVPRMPRAAFSQIVNRSMSEVLTRSLITGLSTVFLLTMILIFGDETLRGFATAMMIGIASGTYSSIFIASPVLTEWKEREPAYRARRRNITEAMGYVPVFPEDNVVARVEGHGEDTDAEPEERLVSGAPPVADEVRAHTPEAEPPAGAPEPPSEPVEPSRPLTGAGAPTETGGPGAAGDEAAEPSPAQANRAERRRKQQRKRRKHGRRR